MAKISYDKFIVLCQQVKEGTISLEEALKELEVKKYVDFEVKLAACAFIAGSLNAILEANDELEKIGENEINIEIGYEKYEYNKLGLLLTYYTNVDFFFTPEKRAEYDLIKELGIDNYVEVEVGRDYDEFSKMIDRISGIDNLYLIYNIRDIFKSLPNIGDLKEATSALNNFNSKDIENLTFLTKMNDPVVTEVAKMIKTNPEEFAKEIEKQDDGIDKEIEIQE